jgi:hypothetical protein
MLAAEVGPAAAAMAGCCQPIALRSPLLLLLLLIMALLPVLLQSQCSF